MISLPSADRLGSPRPYVWFVKQLAACATRRIPDQAKAADQCTGTTESIRKQCRNNLGPESAAHCFGPLPLTFPFGLASFSMKCRLQLRLLCSRKIG